MYNEFKSHVVRREGWTFSYIGSDLVNLAKAKYVEYFNLEQDARNRMAVMMKDMSKSASDKDVRDAQAEIAKYGDLREQCLVYQHEFNRTPDKEFLLHLGDVVFFGMVQSYDPTKWN